MQADGVGESLEPGSLAWASQQIEQIKAGLGDDLGGAYGVEFTGAAELLREHDPVQFRSLRRLLKDKQVRLSQFDRLVEQRRHERVAASRRSRTAAVVPAARIAGSAPAGARRVIGGRIKLDRYLANAEGLFSLQVVGGGAPPVKVPLANFSARIVTEIERDDGVDCVREFEIEARLNGQVRRLVVAAAHFGALRWVTEQLGARAVIAAGRGARERVREAIQLLSSPRLVERTVYTHTGWRRLGDDWVYLHGGGALGPRGVVAGLAASLPAALAPFVLLPPPTGAELKSAIRASLAVLDLAPDQVTVPTLGTVWRSILGAVDFSLFVYGATGRFKSELAALLQQHFGADFAAQRLPGSWEFRGLCRWATG